MVLDCPCPFVGQCSMAFSAYWRSVMRARLEVMSEEKMSQSDGEVKVGSSSKGSESQTEVSALSFSQRLLHWVGWAEGLSWLVLLLVAIPLKYAFGYPALVKSMGPLHGAFFVALFTKCLHSLTLGELRFRDVLAIMGASLIPFGPFLMDRVIKREAAQAP